MSHAIKVESGKLGQTNPGVYVTSPSKFTTVVGKLVDSSKTKSAARMIHFSACSHPCSIELPPVGYFSNSL
jgi:hypothetical protein